MKTRAQVLKITSEQPRPPLTPLLMGIGDPLRWRILAELSAGEPLMVIELAERLRRSADLISKHLAVLRKAGVVEIGRGRLYQIPAHYSPTPGERVLDFGHCLLRFEGPLREAAE